MHAARSGLVFLALMGAATGLLILGACTKHLEGGHGQGVSKGKHVYYSTSDLPKTVTLIDTRTDEIVLSVEIPVGQKLVLRFKEDKGDEESDYQPDLLEWAVMGIKDADKLTERMNVPPTWARRLELTLRDAPELPADMMDEPPGPDEESTARADM